MIFISNFMFPCRRRLLATLAAAMLLPIGASAAPKKKTTTPQKERVVLQITDSDPKRWNLVLSTARTLQTEFGEDKIDVAIVAYGPGVNMLKADSDVANRVESAIARKVFILAGAASLKAHNVDEDSLARHVFVVPSGAAEIVRRQRAGWTYLRP